MRADRLLVLGLAWSLLPGCGPSAPPPPATAPPQAAAPSNQTTPEQQKAADMAMPDLDRSSLVPEERLPTEIPEEEGNPFADAQPVKVEEEVKVQVETEEMKIKRILTFMPVRGLSGFPGSYRVLIGSMALSKGQSLPRLFRDQAEKLQVTDITDKQIFFKFVEGGKVQPGSAERTFSRSFNLDTHYVAEGANGETLRIPRVEQVLPGEIFSEIVEFDEIGQPRENELETPVVDQVIERTKADPGKSLDLPRKAMGEE